MVKVGLVGVGGWGKNHERVLYDLGILGGIFDIDESRAKTIASKYGTKVFASLDDMYASDIDGAVVATPTFTHKEITAKFVAAKKSVLVEKPFVSSYREGIELLGQIKLDDCFIGVGYIERFNPAVEYVKETIDSNKLGGLVFLEFHRESRWPDQVKDVGIMLDTVVHDIDTSRYLLKRKKPLSVYSMVSRVRKNVEDLSVLLLNYGEGAMASFVANWITPKKDRRLVAVFKEGLIELNFITQEIRVETEAQTVIPRLQVKEPLVLEDRAFMEALERRRSFPVMVNDAIENNHIAEAALLSADRGIPIYL